METMHGQIAEWLGLPPMRSSPMRPQSAQARRTGRHTALKASGSDGTLLNKTVASELERVNETLREEHAAMHKHVGALEGEISAMRAELQELRKEMLVGSDKGVIGKMGSSVSGGLGRASSMFFGQQERQHAGTITVRVLRATDLVAADKGGKSDPYMVVQAAGGKKAKTTVKKGTINPVWDETLELSVPDENAPIEFELWDHDKIGMNDSLGSAEIRLTQCAPGIPTALTVPLSTQGAVQAVVTWEPAEPEEVEEQTAGAAKAKETAKKKAAKEVEAMVAAALVDPELDELFRRAMEKGLMEASSREEVLKHLREGRFTAEHYKTMWRARLRFLD